MEIHEEGYESGEEVAATKRQKFDPIFQKVSTSSTSKIYPKDRKREFEKASSQAEIIRQASFLNLNAFDRHKEMINNYYLYYKGSAASLARDTSRDKRDCDVIREHHQFLWDENDQGDSWEKRLAKKYYDKLFKEYCICDLRLFKENKVAMRWRIEKELVEGKGQFICGEKHCTESELLRTWEVNFGYVEHGAKKNALIKLRLCSDCSYKLNYRHKRKEVTKKSKKRKRKEGKREEQRSDKKEVSETTTNEVEVNEVQEEEKRVEQESIWLKAQEDVTEKKREDDFEAYIEDLFL